jgi:hypothetical protein
MREKLINYKAKKVAGKYKTYTAFSEHASKSEKKTVFESTLLQANKVQRSVAHSPR